MTPRPPSHEVRIQRVNFFLAHMGEPLPQNRRGDGQFEMVPLTSRITRLFLGIQLQCVQCHDHPYDNSLKQDMFWSVNAYLRQVERGGTPPNLQQNQNNQQRLTGPRLTSELAWRNDE